MLSHAASALLKRDNIPSAPDYTDPHQLPPWSIFVFMLNAIVFIPVVLVINYTLEKVFPVLAIVEDEKPPAYDPLPVEPLSAAGNAPKPTDAPAPVVAAGKPVTSSFRATWRLLRSHGGFRALFRGLPCLFVQLAIRSIITGALWGSIPCGALFGNLISSLVLVQFSTAWVHIVITAPSPLRFWRRLPAFASTFNATWRPTLIFWAASEAANWTSVLIVGAAKLDNQSELSDASKAWRGLAAVISIVVLQVLVLVPAYVVLVRVQASLLPDDHETIIPFDRSFNGRIEPAVVGGLGYATVRDAWASFSKSAWRRIVLLHVKITAVSVVAVFVVAAVVIPQFILMASFGSRVDGNAELSEM
ncbi:hypothetical protein FZEAL_4637 [Fusarium zealandicum]|uniref:Ubiquitin carrier protein n=1 Tax=Fusarium zealandicum TaxID=1053134 RepID=A0A8H4UMA5_9HYPO|nr:hypothetical protein FZEAL_4637 [Fusarium zealandicum]